MMPQQYAGGRVLAAVRDAGAHGATVAELVASLSLHPKTISKYLRRYAVKGELDCHELDTPRRGRGEKVWFDPRSV